MIFIGIFVIFVCQAVIYMFPVKWPWLLLAAGGFPFIWLPELLEKFVIKKRPPSLDRIKDCPVSEEPICKQPYLSEQAYKRIRAKKREMEDAYFDMKRWQENSDDKTSKSGEENEK